MRGSRIGALVALLALTTTASAQVRLPWRSPTAASGFRFLSAASAAVGPNQLANGDFSANPGGWSIFDGSIVAGALKWSVPFQADDGEGSGPGDATHALVSVVAAGSKVRVTLTKTGMLNPFSIAIGQNTVQFTAGSGTEVKELTTNAAGSVFEIITNGSPLNGSSAQETGSLDDILVQVMT